MELVLELIGIFFVCYVAYAVLFVNKEAEHGDELGYKAGEIDGYSRGLGDEWNSEEDDDE